MLNMKTRISYPYMAGAIICWVIDVIYQTRETVFHPKTENRVENTTHRGIGLRAMFSRGRGDESLSPKQVPKLPNFLQNNRAQTIFKRSLHVVFYKLLLFNSLTRFLCNSGDLVKTIRRKNCIENKARFSKDNA